MRAAWADPRGRWLLAAAALVVAAAVLVWGRGWLGERLLPDPRLNRRLEQGQAALQAGKLTAADGSGARELFESVLAVDPDQMQAREGLLAVRQAAVARAQAALSARRLREAEAQLALAHALSAPQVELQPLQARLRDLREANADLGALLAQAAAPEIDEDRALALYAQVLALDADNPTAIEGRDRRLSARLQRAQAALAAGRVAEGRRLVESVIAADPAHLDLPPARAALGEAQSALQARQAAALARAAQDERRGRLDRAALGYRALLEEDPALTAASEGLLRLATRLALQAQRQAEDFDFARAQRSLDKARRWSPGAPQLQLAERSLQRSRQARGRLQPRSRRDRERVPGLLAEASKAIARGDLITPPGASAWDRLRVAAAIDPDSEALARLERDFSVGAQRCFDQALGEGRLGRAQACLEARMLQDPASVTESARTALAERWLGYAQERIGAADWAQAEAALVNVRRWQPQHPGLDAAQARLRTARGPTPTR